MDKNFDAKAAEPRIYAKWEADGCFKAGVGARVPKRSVSRSRRRTSRGPCIWATP